jgi:tRNA (guanosine-2'-O-)-methyltransferase
VVAGRSNSDDELVDTAAVKTERFPNTSRRQERVEYVLARRQPTLTAVLEDVHDLHNVSAVLRSCDAVGVLDVHVVYVHETPPATAFHRKTSASAAKWIRVHFHESVEACFQQLRTQGMEILATALSDDADAIYEQDLTKPTALVFGNEHRGVSRKALELADGLIAIPMQGMVESLNISVACAVSLYEAMRQRRAAGMYDQPQLDAATHDLLRHEWLRK